MRGPSIALLHGTWQECRHYRPYSWAFASERLLSDTTGYGYPMHPFGYPTRPQDTYEVVPPPIRQQVERWAQFPPDPPRLFGLPVCIDILLPSGVVSIRDSRGGELARIVPVKSQVAEDAA